MMVKNKRIPASEIKNVRSFGGDIEMVVTELKGRPVPIGEIQNIRSFVADRIAIPDRAKK
jgi:hypothetical protein